MQALSLHCPLHGIIMSWPEGLVTDFNHPTSHCWMVMVDGTKCGLPLSLRVWPDPLTPDAPLGMVEQMERPDISKSSESSDPEVIRFLLERGDYHVMERAIAALSSVSQCASCGSYERIAR